MAAILALESPLSQCGTLRATNPTGGVTEGELTALGNLYGFAFATSPDDQISPNSSVIGSLSGTDKYTHVYRAHRVKVPKDSGVTITIGEIAYFDAATEKFDDTAGSGKPALGYWVEPAASADTHGYIDFDGRT